MKPDYMWGTDAEVMSRNTYLQGEYDGTNYFAKESERAEKHLAYVLESLQEIQDEMRARGLEVTPSDIRPVPDWVYYGFESEEDYVPGNGCGVPGCCVPEDGPEAEAYYQKPEVKGAIEILNRMLNEDN